MKVFNSNHRGCHLSVRLLDQQEIPALHLHYISPGDVMCLSTARTELPIDMAPHFLQQTRYSAERSKVCQVAKALQALLEERPEWRAGSRDGTANQVNPNERAIEANLARWDELQSLSQLGDESDARGLRRREAWHKAAEVDARGNAERRCDVLAQLLWAQDAVGVEWDLWSRVVDLRETDLVAERVDVLAQLDVIHAVLLESLETSDLGDQIHDSVLATHQLTKSQGRVRGREVLLPVGVGEGWGAALDGRAENVDPGGKGHVEGYQIM